MILIGLDYPKQLRSKTFANKLTAFLKEYKTNEVHLLMKFVCDNPEQIANEFKVLRNKIAFELRCKL